MSNAAKINALHLQVAELHRRVGKHELAYAAINEALNVAGGELRAAHEGLRIVSAELAAAHAAHLSTDELAAALTV